MKTIFLFLFSLPLNSCYSELRDNSLPINHQSINFSRYHREYGFKEYDRDSIKFIHPLQYIKSIYYINYTLNKKELIIYKSSRENYNVPIILSKTLLNKNQISKFHNAIDNIKLDSTTIHNANLGTDDGFQVEVKLTKSGNVTSFSWNNSYIPPLFDLLSLANTLSPDSLRFYPVDEEAAFVRYLQSMPSID